MNPPQPQGLAGVSYLSSHPKITLSRNRVAYWNVNRSSQAPSSLPRVANTPSPRPNSPMGEPTRRALMPEVQAAVTAIVAVAALVIAWRQYQTARAKLRLDLYERRYQVYLALVA